MALNNKTQIAAWQDVTEKDVFSQLRRHRLMQICRVVGYVVGGKRYYFYYF